MGGKDDNNEAQQNSLSRFCASFLTWPVEKSKLIYQARRHSSSSSSSPLSPSPPPPPPLSAIQRYISVMNIFRSLPYKDHIMGMTSSGLQRGGSAFIMFYAQSHVYQIITSTSTAAEGTTTTTILSSSSSLSLSSYPLFLNHAIAGSISGAISSPFHTYWELIKVRGILPTWSSYSICIPPMIFRHGIFDATFFGVNAYLLELEKKQKIEDDNDNDHHRLPLISSSGIRFAISASIASFSNLWWDVWKTRQMQHSPKIKIRFLRGIVLPLHWGTTSFWSNYFIKGTDLTINWFVVGCIKDIIFPSS